MTTRTRKALALVASAPLLASPILVLGGGAQAAPGPNDETRIFNPTIASLGPLADASGAVDAASCTAATPGVTEVPIAVSGIATPLSDVRVRLGLDHDTVGDLSVFLVAPDGTTVPVFRRPGAGADGACGSTDRINGAFAFYDGGAPTLSGLTATSNGVVTTGALAAESARGVATSLTTPFAGKAPNGTWRLRIVDSAPDAGSENRLYAASLTLSSIPKSATTQCKSATTTDAAAAAAVASAQNTFDKAAKKLKKAKKKDLPAEKKAKKAKKKAKAALAAAQASAATAATAKKSACS